MGARLGHLRGSHPAAYRSLAVRSAAPFIYLVLVAAYMVGVLPALIPIGGLFVLCVSSFILRRGAMEERRSLGLRPAESGRQMLRSGGYGLVLLAAFVVVIAYFVR
ncbi:MAG TPA: hypothetical protein VI341_09160 [Actinomycetota bacterium]